MIGGIIIGTFIICVILGAAWQTWSDVYHEHLERKLYRRELRQRNNAHGSGGMYD